MIAVRAWTVPRGYRLQEARLSTRETFLMAACTSGVQCVFATTRAIDTTSDGVANAYAEFAVFAARLAWSAALDALEWREL